MIKNYLTCERYLKHYNKGEKTVVARMNDTQNLYIVERDQPDLYFDNNPIKILCPDEHYLVGPIVDTLHAYEELGYSPEELKKMIAELEKLRDVTKKVAEEKITFHFDPPKLHYEHTTSPIGSVTTFNLPDPKKDPITEVRNMSQMDQYFEDRNLKVVRKYNKTYSRYTFTLSYAGVSRDYHFTYPTENDYAEKCKKMTKFCEGAYECFDKEVRSQVRVTYAPARQSGKSLLDDAKAIDYIKQDIAIQKKVYEAINRPDIECLYPNFMFRDIGKIDELSKWVNTQTRINPKHPIVKDVIFNDPATIVFWKDGTKTVVKAQGEPFDPEKGLAMAFSKKMFGNDRDYYIQFLRWLKKAKNGAERKTLDVKEARNARKSDS